MFHFLRNNLSFTNVHKLKKKTLCFSLYFTKYKSLQIKRNTKNLQEQKIRSSKKLQSQTTFTSFIQWLRWDHSINMFIIFFSSQDTD